MRTREAGEEVLAQHDLGWELALAPLTTLEALRPGWSAIEAAADGSFFLSWTWIGTWLEQTGIRPYVLTVRCDDRPVAIALLNPGIARRHRVLAVRQLSLHETGDPAIDALAIEHNGLLVAKDAPAATIDRCLGFIAGAPLRDLEGGHWDELRLSGVPRAYAEAHRPVGLKAWVVAEQPCYGVDLEGLRRAGRGYLASLSANSRQQIRRALKLYAARGAIDARPAASLDEAFAFLAALKQRHDAYWQAQGLPGAFRSAFFGDFHRRLIETAWPKGEVELFAVTAGGEAIGYLYNFVYRGVASNYLSGFAYEADNRLKPGLVTHCLCVEHHLRLGHRLYDLMAGDSRYKRSLAEPYTELVWCLLQRPRPLLMAESALRRLKQRLESWRAPAKRHDRDGPELEPSPPSR